jgi:hypothetical protein
MSAKGAKSRHHAPNQIFADTAESTLQAAKRRLMPFVTAVSSKLGDRNVRRKGSLREWPMGTALPSWRSIFGRASCFRGENVTTLRKT